MATSRVTKVLEKMKERMFTVQREHQIAVIIYLSDDPDDDEEEEEDYLAGPRYATERDEYLSELEKKCLLKRNNNRKPRYGDVRVSNRRNGYNNG